MCCCCTPRCLLIAVCIIQLLTTVERQVFEFLGFLWTPVIANFVHIVFIIIGLCGACKYRHRVVVVYAIWCLIWLAWNIFVICFYLEVGLLNRETSISILNLGISDSHSWWKSSGLVDRCVCDSSTALTAGNVTASALNVSDSATELSPTVSSTTTTATCSLISCLLTYYYVEVLHAAVQCALAIIGFCVACSAVYVFTEEDDSSEPVHGELEYIKMRYRSPARQSFRTQKNYDNLTTSSRSNTLDRILPKNRRRSTEHDSPPPRPHPDDSPMPPGITDIIGCGEGDMSPVTPLTVTATPEHSTELPDGTDDECFTLQTRVA